MGPHHLFAELQKAKRAAREYEQHIATGTSPEVAADRMFESHYKSADKPAAKPKSRRHEIPIPRLRRPI